jgi:hypothetical protein
VPGRAVAGSPVVRRIVSDDGVCEEPRETEPGRASLVGHRHRTRQLLEPAHQIAILRREPGSMDLPITPSRAAATTDRACTSRPTLVR